MKHSGDGQLEDWRNGGFGLYVHWPYCASKCPYCDFNSHVSNAIDHKRWREAYTKEIARVADLTPYRTLDSIFFGGGTPSTMDPATVDAIIQAARKAWPTRNSIEITLEANPTSVDLAKFRDFAAAGVNRVSLGIQSLDDEALRLLGRRHSVVEALKAWDVANLVFDRSSFDLIYARQFQDVHQWTSELTAALALNPSHLSLYQLTIEDGTAFGDRYRLGSLRGLPSDDVGADLYELTQDLCNDRGLLAYEVSNHAKPGNESQHNLIYWRYGDYIGIGPGAHGRLTLSGEKYAIEAIKAPIKWLEGAIKKPTVGEIRTALSPREQAAEYLMMSLRLSEGTTRDRWLALGGVRDVPAALAEMIDHGFLWQTNERFGTTLAGRQILNSVLRELL